MSQVDFETEPYRAQVAEQPAKRGCGCWVWGCLSLLVIGVLGTAGIGVGGYMLVSKQVKRYTSDAPKELPVVDVDPERVVKLKAKIENFKEVAEQGTGTDELVLTADDLNALVQSEEALQGKVFVEIENGQVGGDVSFPADVFPGGKGRFFNARATFDVSMDQGVLIVTITEAEVNGEQLPAHVMDGLRRENLAKDAYKDPEHAKLLRRVESITFDDDKMVLKLRPDNGETADESKPPQADEQPEADQQPEADEQPPADDEN